MPSTLFQHQVTRGIAESTHIDPISRVTSEEVTLLKTRGEHVGIRGYSQ